MWSLEKPRIDRAGTRWQFAYWHQGPRDDPQTYPQQLFFWDQEQMECGVVLFERGKTARYPLIRNLMDKLVADPALRKEHSRPLRFPLERYYRNN
jgi:hypothetical protein